MNRIIVFINYPLCTRFLISNMSSNRSPLWQFFSISAVDKKFVVCKFCSVNISRGSEDPKKQTTSSMKTLMLSKHPVEFKEPTYLTQATSSQSELNIKNTPELSIIYIIKTQL